MQVVWRKFVLICPANPALTSMSDPYFPHTVETLRQIVTMPRNDRKPVSYDEANRRFVQAYQEYCLSQESTYESAKVFCLNFVHWLSGQGFYLDLKHDEYQSLGGLQ